MSHGVAEFQKVFDKNRTLKTLLYVTAAPVRKVRPGIGVRIGEYASSFQNLHEVHVALLLSAIKCSFFGRTTVNAKHIIASATSGDLCLPSSFGFHGERANGCLVCLCLAKSFVSQF